MSDLQRDIEELDRAVRLYGWAPCGEAWQRLRERLTAPPAAVPEGYALVPVEPTEAMQEAFDSCRRDGARLPETYWSAGIAAAQGKQ